MAGVLLRIQDCLAGRRIVRDDTNTCAPGCRGKLQVQLLAARVMNALAACSANCRLIVNAGALEPVVDVLCGTSEQATEVATFLLVRLVEVDSPLLLDFNMSALAMLLELLLVRGRVVCSQPFSHPLPLNLEDVLLSLSERFRTRLHQLHTWAVD